MNWSLRTCFLAPCFALAATASFAGLSSYQCTVSEAYTLAAGTLERSPWVASKGDSFSVDRNDGRIVGGAAYANGHATSVIVLKRGDAAWSFKSVSTWGSGSGGLGEYRTLLVKEFVDGASKPFLMSDSWGNVYTGFCR